MDYKHYGSPPPVVKGEYDDTEFCIGRKRKEVQEKMRELEKCLTATPEVAEEHTKRLAVIGP